MRSDALDQNQLNPAEAERKNRALRRLFWTIVFLDAAVVLLIAWEVVELFIKL